MVHPRTSHPAVRKRRGDRSLRQTAPSNRPTSLEVRAAGAGQPTPDDCGDRPFGDHHGRLFRRKATRGYSLPLDPGSSRAWRFAWDPIFFEFCSAAAGALRFDFATYRSFDPATRRLYLLLKKVFWRSDSSPDFDLHDLALITMRHSINALELSATGSAVGVPRVATRRLR
jgi:hypothetical protein